MKSERYKGPGFFVIRHNILTPGNAGWKIADRAYSEYESELFEPQRLSARGRLFRWITVAPLAGMEVLEDIEPIVLALTSTKLPKWAKDELLTSAEVGIPFSF